MMMSRSQNDGTINRRAPGRAGWDRPPLGEPRAPRGHHRGGTRKEREPLTRTGRGDASRAAPQGGATARVTVRCAGCETPFFGRFCGYDTNSFWHCEKMMRTTRDETRRTERQSSFSSVTRASCVSDSRDINVADARVTCLTTGHARFITRPFFHPLSLVSFSVSRCEKQKTFSQLVVYHPMWRYPSPAYTASAPSSSSIRRSWLYFASRSDLHGAPVLICPVARPTARSAM